jgi:hypothetical protein
MRRKISQNKRDRFREWSGTTKTIQLVVVAPHGVEDSSLRRRHLHAVVTLDDLFGH